MVISRSTAAREVPMARTTASSVARAGELASPVQRPLTDMLRPEHDQRARSERSR